MHLDKLNVKIDSMQEVMIMFDEMEEMELQKWKLDKIIQGRLYTWHVMEIKNVWN